jgi:hypothetical protein
MKHFLFATGLLLSVGACKSGGADPSPTPPAFTITGHWQTEMVYARTTARGAPDQTFQVGGPSTMDATSTSLTVAGEAVSLLNVASVPRTPSVTTSYAFHAPSLTYPAQPTGGTDSLVVLDATSFRWSSLRSRNRPPYSVYRYTAVFHR